MKMRTFTLSMMTLLLSAGPLMAMDSEYQEKRREALESKSGSSVDQEDSSIDRSRDLDVSELNIPAGDGWEQTRESLRYWWQ